LAVAVVITLVLLHVVLTLNLRRFMRPRVSPVVGSVSVLIPARNEERNIDRCVRSLVGQENVREVVVLDDDSSDRTSEIVASIGAPGLKLIRGKPLPPEWRGKNWACHQLAEAAFGEWLLFTDADTIHEPQSVAAALCHAIDTQADLLSLFPRQLVGTWLERLIIPLLNFTFVSFFPAFMLERTSNPRFHAANGQFLFFRRTAYEQIGGHAAIRGSVVDDFALARRIREKHLRLVIGDGQDFVSCRMYETPREIIEGFTKNLFAAMGGSALRAVSIALFLLIVFVVPVVAAIVTRSVVWIAAALLGIAMRLRVTAQRRDDSIASALLHPVAMAVVVFVLLRSMMRTLLGMHVQWKGRKV
jgi:chlorobactene glucosyltransferase